MMKRALLAAAVALLASPAFAQDGRPFLVVPSTPDISISATASADIAMPGGRVDWIAIKNECSTRLYFNLNPTTKTSTNYPLRLGPGESFSGPFQVYTLGVSNDQSAACRFTVQGGRR